MAVPKQASEKVKKPREPRDKRVQQPFDSDDVRVEKPEKTDRKIPEERKNPHFVQLALHKIPDLRHHNQEQPIAVTILMFLAEHMGENNLVICSQKVIEDELSLSRATVYRALKYLSDKSLVCVVKFGNTNGYAVNGELFWKTWHGPERYLVFENVKALGSREENRKTHAKLTHAFSTQGSLFKEGDNG